MYSMNFKNKWLLGLALLFLIASAFFVLKKWTTQATAKPKIGNVIETIYGLGTVVADQAHRVRAGMTLSVRKLFVTEGNRVRAGDSLVQLDESILRSKIEGTVTLVAYKEDELVMPQMTVVTVTNLDHLYLEVSLEQQAILRVQHGQKVFVSFESLRNEKYEGLVTSVYPRENQFIVRIEIKKWPTGVLPGMTADVAILVGQKENVLMIPLQSIVAGKVARIRDGKKDRLPVKLGVIDGEWGEVLSDNISQSDDLVIRK